MNRRKLFKIAGATIATGMTASCATAKKEERVNPFKKSFCLWCYNGVWNVDQAIDAAVKLGCHGIELVPKKDWPKLKAAGLECSVVSAGHGYVKAMNNRKFHDECVKSLTQAIDDAHEAGYKNVITFIGFADTTNEGGSLVTREEGIKNSIDGFRRIVGYAEKKGVILQLEMLNSRDPVKMKGHPGYQGDNLEFCGEVIRTVNSPNLKLLFDIYHVQIMQGDLCRRIEENIDIIGHIHTAGCPGRNELDDRQEINYPAVIQKLADLGYKGYVTHEFIPTRDPYEGLVEAFANCSVRPS
jgi:hydroxypyruvate isomerase